MTPQKNLPDMSPCHRSPSGLVHHPAPAIKILLADKHTLFRQALCKSLLQLPDQFLAYEAATGHETIDFLAHSHIDIVLLDIQMPVMKGIETVRHIKKDYPAIKILVLTELNESSLIIYLLQLGINGYLLKNVGLEELEKAIIETICKGDYSSALVAGILNKHLSVPEEFPNLSLSPREFQLLELIKIGMSNKEMASFLKLEVFTVESYRKSLMQKTKCRNIADVVSFAYKVGI